MIQISPKGRYLQFSEEKIDRKILILKVHFNINRQYSRCTQATILLLINDIINQKK